MTSDNIPDPANDKPSTNGQGAIDADHILRWFRDYFYNRLGVKKELVTLDAQFTKDMGLCSIEGLNLMMEFEEEFNLDIENMLFDSDLYETETVRQVIELMSD